jgi:hypothetical protein
MMELPLDQRLKAQPRLKIQGGVMSEEREYLVEEDSGGGEAPEFIFDHWKVMMEGSPGELTFPVHSVSNDES